VLSTTGGSTSDLTLDLCRRAKEELNLNPNMHLTCTNMELEKVVAALEGCKSSGSLTSLQSVCVILTCSISVHPITNDSLKPGLTNILALRGDPPAG
jgi:5,10-methylenetetrahydrofolate reductase